MHRQLLLGAFFKQVSNQTVGAPGLGGKSDLSGPVGRYAYAAIRGQGVMHLTQRMGIEFGHHKAPVAAKAAAGDARGFDDLLNAQGQQLA